MIGSGRERGFINYGSEDEMKIWGYKKSPTKIVLVSALIILSLGVFGLIFYWKRDWLLKWTSSSCPLSHADAILLTDKWDDIFVEYVTLESRNDSSRKKKRTFWPVSLTWTSNVHQRDINSLKNGEECPDDPLSTAHIITQRYFYNKKLKYIWNEDKEMFQSLILPPMKCSFISRKSCLTQQESRERYWMYGENFIRVHLTPIIVILITQGLTPFYVFQVFSILLWSAAESYYYYSACIFLMSVVSLIAQIVQERMMERALKKTVNNISTCLVARPGREGVMFEETSSINLVPGDVIQIPSSGCFMQCDAVLNSGTAIVNESMLTGESVPITKTSVLDNELVFNEKDHNRNILYCGTCVIQTRTVNMQPVTAMVIRTGFLTTKGSLICSILYPKSMDFKFTKDSYKYVAALSCVAVVGMVYTACCMALNGSVAEDVIIRMLDIVTIVVPPALPAALTYSIAIAQYRLKRNSIFCLNSKSINVCGSLDAFCFDKTGTLTEDGLDIYCIQPCGSPGNDVISSNSDSGIVFCSDDNIRFMKPIYMNEKDETSKHSQPLSSYYLDHIRINMASCHSLVCLDGIFCGDPIDLKMFEYTQWDFIEYEDATITDLNTPIVVKPKLENQEKMIPEYGVLKQMPFSSKLQRMSVIVRSQQRAADSFDPLNTFSVYAKGSPETISSLSIAHTVPANFKQVLVHYTRQGFRVLALAWKPLYSDVPTSDVNDILKIVEKMDREQIESSLIFLGLIVMENKLKKETISTIKKLKNADIKIVMVTGDNLLTALNIAHKCFFIERNESVYFISLDTPNNSVDIPMLSFCQINEFEDDHVEKITLNDFLGVSSSESNLKEAEVKQTKYHFAITGKMWKLFRAHYPDLISKLVVRGTIFARFSPDQKKQLVEELQAVGYYVGMCGDGANDCGALKTAHSGISLSETEASVASPFTSKQANISCVVRLVREGRCALATSFGIFKFMTSYSMNQFLIACIFIWNLTLLSDMQFMYQDIFMLTPLSFTFCFTSSYKVLVARKPMISLVAFTPLLSIVTNLALNLATMIFMYYFTKNQTWYEDGVTDEFISHLSTCIYLVTAIHIPIMAVIYSRGPPFQKYFMFNYAFVINLIIVITASYLMIMYSNPWWSTLMKFKMPPSYEYRGVIVGITTFHFILCYLFEKHVIGEYVETIVQPWLSKLCLKTATKYEIIERELSVNEEWPRVTRMDIDHFMDREVDVEPDTEPEQPKNSLNEKRQECPPGMNDHAKKISSMNEISFHNKCFQIDCADEETEV